MWGLKRFLLRGSSRRRVDRESPPGPGGLPAQRGRLRAPAPALTPGREVVAPRPTKAGAGEGLRMRERMGAPEERRETRSDSDRD